MTLVLRPARSDEAIPVAKLHFDTRVATYTGRIPQAVLDGDSLERRIASWSERLADPTRRIFVADEAGRIVGLACAGPMPERPNGHDSLPAFDAYLYSLYVDPAQHGSGVGRKLLRGLSERLLADGLHAMALHTVGNNPARGFYEHLGARLVREEIAEQSGQHWQLAVYGWDDLRPLTLPQKKAP
jgi:ribosomal protein S18 acetylase RimI-like enzyme